MPRKKEWRKDLYNSRAFVESMFGQGSAAGKTTTNLNSFRRAVAKNFRADGIPKKERKIASADLDALSGGNTSLGLKRRKQFYYLKNKSTETQVHEFAHGAYRRICSMLGKEANAYAGEAIAASVELEWLRAIKPVEYLSAKIAMMTLLKEAAQSSSAFDGFASQVHNTGFVMAYFIDNIPGADARIRIRQELANCEFDSPSAAIAWIMKHTPKKRPLK